MHETRYLFNTSHEETGLHLTFLFTSFKTEFNPLTIRHTTVSKQISSTNNIFKTTAFTYFSFTKGVQKVP